MNNVSKFVLIAGFVLTGFGCAHTTPPESMPTNTSVISQPVNTEVVTTTTNIVTTSDSAVKPLVVARTFTLEEIEANGGVKNWFRDLARANAAGKKTLVRVPVNHVFGFGCETPTNYCVSTQTSGCYGPYLDLKGATELINRANQRCEQACDLQISDALDLCTPEVRDRECSTLWSVEGYVTAASRVPENTNDGEGSCAHGELVYDFKIERVIQKIEGGFDEEFSFVEYVSK